MRGWIAAGVLVIMCTAGCEQPIPEVTLTQAERLELETRSLSLLMAAAESDDPMVAANAIEALVRVAPQIGVPLYRQALDADSPLIRYAGLVAVGEVRDCGALPRVRTAVYDSHRHVRLAAAFAAVRCGREGYARLLVNTVSDVPDEALRADAAALLGRLKDPRAEGWLRAALTMPMNKRSTRVTVALYGALARLGKRDAIDQLVYYSQGATDARVDALLLLAELAIPDARDALRYRLLGIAEEYNEARLIAARGLGRLGYDDGFKLAMQHVDFVDRQRHNDPESPDRTFSVRSLAIHALAEIGDPRALPRLRALAADSSDPRLQVAAAYAIYRILHP